MTRRRSNPWIYKWSRLIIAAITTCGTLTTAYLTYEKLNGKQAACLIQTSVNNCNDVLSSPWAMVFGKPLALFGFLAYTCMLVCAVIPLILKSDTNKQQNQKIEDLTWLILLAGATAMTIFSGYLIYLLIFKIQALCFYCIASALFSVSIFALTVVGHAWEDVGQIFFTTIIVGMITVVGTIAVHANVSSPTISLHSTPAPIGKPNRGIGWEITTTSKESELELAVHLTRIGAKKYSAWWCPHCHEQKQLFGKEATEKLDIIECDPQGKNAAPNLCQAAKIEGFPTWEINGKLYPNVQPLKRLADVSDYQGPREFKNYPDYFK